MKRFRLDYDDLIAESAEGEYVLFSDVEAAIAEAVAAERARCVAEVRRLIDGFCGSDQRAAEYVLTLLGEG